MQEARDHSLVPIRTQDRRERGGATTLRAAGVEAFTPLSTRRRWTSRWSGRISRRRSTVRGCRSRSGGGPRIPGRRGGARCGRTRCRGSSSRLPGFDGRWLVGIGRRRRPGL